MKRKQWNSLCLQNVQTITAHLLCPLFLSYSDLISPHLGLTKNSPHPQNTKGNNSLQVCFIVIEPGIKILTSKILTNSVSRVWIMHLSYLKWKLSFVSSECTHGIPWNEWTFLTEVYKSNSHESFISNLPTAVRVTLRYHSWNLT